MGDRVNLAARLMQGAEPKSLLTETSTYLRSQNESCLRFEPAGEKKFKGMSQLVPTYAAELN